MAESLTSSRGAIRPIPASSERASALVAMGWPTPAAAQRDNRPTSGGHPGLDETNTLILHALAHRGRTSIHDIAELVGRTESTVRDRVDSLERQGILLGYEARIDWARVGLPLEVSIEAMCPPAKAVEVARLLQTMPNVLHAATTTGELNLHVLLRAREIGDIPKFLAQLAAAPLLNVQTRITLEHLVADRPPRPSPGGMPWAAVREPTARLQARPAEASMQAAQAVPSEALGASV